MGFVVGGHVGAVRDARRRRRPGRRSAEIAERLGLASRTIVHARAQFGNGTRLSADRLHIVAATGRGTGRTIAAWATWTGRLRKPTAPRPQCGSRHSRPGCRPPDSWRTVGARRHGTPGPVADRPTPGGRSARGVRPRGRLPRRVRTQCRRSLRRRSGSRGLLGLAGDGDECSGVASEDAEPVGEVGGVVVAGRGADAGGSAPHCGAELGDKLLSGVGVGAEPSREVAGESGGVAGPVDVLVGRGGVVVGGVVELGEVRAGGWCRWRAGSRRRCRRCGRWRRPLRRRLRRPRCVRGCRGRCRAGRR